MAASLYTLGFVRVNNGSVIKQESAGFPVDYANYKQWFYLLFSEGNSRVQLVAPPATNYNINSH
eukprot:470264-Pyramimonas_sp.AAC.1